MEKIYDSESEADSNFIYEKVFKIYQKLSSETVKPYLTVNDMVTKFETISVPGIDLSKVDLDEIFSQLHDWEMDYSKMIHVYDLFDILELAAKQLDKEFINFVDSLTQ